MVSSWLGVFARPGVGDFDVRAATDLTGSGEGDCSTEQRDWHWVSCADTDAAVDDSTGVVTELVKTQAVDDAIDSVIEEVIDVEAETVHGDGDGDDLKSDEANITALRFFPMKLISFTGA